MGKKVVDAKENAEGNIIAVQFQGNQSFTPLERAMDMAERGEVDNAHVVHLKSGKRYLRSNPDQTTGNNLDEMARD